MKDLFFLPLTILTLTLSCQIMAFNDQQEEGEYADILPTQGINQDEILFGQSAALSGPAKNLGQSMRNGILAAFHQINGRGGVRNRKLKLVTRDDTYESVPATTNIRHLLKVEKVFAFIGGVGTPTSKAVLPIVAETPLLYLGPLTGATFLRTEYLDTAINVRASYAQETYKMVDHLKNGLNIDRIGVFYQSDSYGIDGFNGVKAAVSDIGGIEIVSEGTYPRNTNDVQWGVVEIHRGNPQAIIIIGTSPPTAVFIRQIEDLGILDKSTVFMTVAKLEENPGQSKVFVTQVVPDFLTDSPLSRNYMRAMEEIGQGESTNMVSLEGYIVGRLAISALERVEGEITHESFSRAFRNHVFDIDGFKLSFDGKDDNQGSDRVFLKRLENTRTK